MMVDGKTVILIRESHDCILHEVLSWSASLASDLSLSYPTFLPLHQSEPCVVNTTAGSFFKTCLAAVPCH